VSSPEFLFGVGSGVVTDRAEWKTGRRAEEVRRYWVGLVTQRRGFEQRAEKARDFAAGLLG
jgi:hypothetical protein